MRIHFLLGTLSFLSLFTSACCLCDLCVVDGMSCNTSYFPCFEDCCGRGTAFCDPRMRRCRSCEDRKILCDTDAMPVECLIYCQKQQLSASDQGVIRVPIAAVIVTSIVIGACVIAVVLQVMCCCFRKQAPQLAQNNTCEELKNLISGTDKDVEAAPTPDRQRPQVDSRRPSSMASSASDSTTKSKNTVNPDDLGLRTVDTDSALNVPVPRQPSPGAPQHPVLEDDSFPTTATNCPAGANGPCVLAPSDAQQPSEDVWNGSHGPQLDSSCVSLGARPNYSITCTAQNLPCTDRGYSATPGVTTPIVPTRPSFAAMQPTSLDDLDQRAPVATGTKPMTDGFVQAP